MEKPKGVYSIFFLLLNHLFIIFFNLCVLYLKIIILFGVLFLILILFVILYRKTARQSIINPDWDFQKMGIGGLDKEFNAIFRRAFASRVFPPEFVEQLGKKIFYFK